jgi:hypothetical protein
MATIDITASMQRSTYGENDQWVSKPTYLADKPGEQAARIELVMYSKYIRRECNFTVLYQGPGGSMRVEQGGPEVPGPIGDLIPQATVISAHRGPRVNTVHVQEGDVLVINGQRMVILDDKPRTDYPRLVTEVEAGILAALAVIREKLSAALAEQPGTEAQNASRNDRQALLTGLRHDVARLLPELRERYASPATR